LTGGAKNVQRWLHLGGEEPAPLPVEAVAADPDQSILADPPLPPRRDEAVHMASLHSSPIPPVRRPSPADTPADASDSSNTASPSAQ
jgi:hypothetical protein